MGTNVYVRLKLTELMKEKAIEAIKNDDYENLKEIIDYGNPIHIGKRSAGWQFLFEMNSMYYAENRKSIEEFLNRDDVIIEDEYGGRYTSEEFWKEFVDDFANGITMQEYVEESRSNDKDSLANKWIYDTQLNFEHISDGLRFSNSKDFC